MDLVKNISSFYFILAFYLCEVENIGSSAGNDLSGFVYIDTKTVDAKFFVCFLLKNYSYLMQIFVLVDAGCVEAN